jgi:hypothetical protein
MSDKGRIAAGLAVFLLLAAYPLWNGLASAADPERPVLERAADPSGCVEDTLFMRGNHAILLNQWRNDVVRNGQRFYTNAAGTQVDMSLTDTCLTCHGGHEAFCDRCHTYSDVQPTCWDCHVNPEGR